jgi:elongation factor 1 alpha-like protein
LKTGRFEYASDEHQEIANSPICSTPFSAADFFKDSPWLQIPEHRRAEITIQPLYPRVGLLGGASKGSKMSKLAALAAKRKQQANEQSGSVSANTPPCPDDYTANLNKLRISKNPPYAHETEDPGTQKQFIDVDMVKDNATDDPRALGRQSNPLKNQTDQSTLVDSNIRGRPSAFASIMTSQAANKESQTSSDVLSNGLLTKSFDFTEPSPDDIVTEAQNVKGRT